MIGLEEDSVRYAHSGPSQRFLRGLRPLVSVGPLPLPVSAGGHASSTPTINPPELYHIKYSYSFDIQKNSYIILGYDVRVQEGNIRKTMAARGLVNGRGPRSGRDLVFRCYPPELLPPQKKTEADL